ncbi:hypothetical protein K9L16_03450 [Candidatus Pacearchaeota archaeon]|nr:hypothetical protein [Candidatus Pacearchaeota archaeon]
MVNLNVERFIQKSGVEEIIGEKIIFYDEKQKFDSGLFVLGVNYTDSGKIRTLKVGLKRNIESGFISAEDFKYYFVKNSY